MMQRGGQPASWRGSGQRGGGVRVRGHALSVGPLLAGRRQSPHPTTARARRRAAACRAIVSCYEPSASVL